MSIWNVNESNECIFGEMPIRDPNKVHVALALVLDVSGSMGMLQDGIVPIQFLNDSVNKMIRDMKNDSKLKTIVDLAIFTFGDSARRNSGQGFRAIEDISEGICLEANDGSTYVVEVLKEAIEETRERSNSYSAGAYKPWIIVITDGYFHDNEFALNEVGQIMQNREMDGKQRFFGFGVGDQFKRAQLEKFCLPQDSHEKVVNLQYADFDKLFSWIGASMKAVSNNKPDAPSQVRTPRSYIGGTD